MLELLKQTLAENLSDLLKRYPDVSRLDLSRRIQVADGTLGRIKYGTGNPQLENLWQIAEFFKIQPWQLLVREGHKLPRDFDPFKVLVPSIQSGHLCVPILETFPYAGTGGESDDWSVVRAHIDVAEGWARKHFGQTIDRIRALSVQGDSMSPTLNEGDLAFVDIGCARFEMDGIYAVVWNDRLFIKRLVVNLAHDRLEVCSDNPMSPASHIPTTQVNNLTICGRVKTWLAIKGY